MRAVIDNLVREGLALHQAGRFDEANRLYKQVLELDPGHADALHLSGLVALQSGRPADAAALIGRAAGLQPRNWAYRANLASALLQLNEYDRAFEAFRAAAKLNPDDPQLQIAGANCLALRGDFAGAEAQLRKIVRRHPGAASAWFNLGNAVRDQGCTEEAAKLYARAVQLDSNDPDARLNLGSMLHRLQRFDEAIGEYRAAIALRSSDAAAHCNLASALIDVGRFSEAEAAARAALRIDASQAVGHSMLAAALSGQGRLEDALPAYRDALAADPANVRLASALGSALFEAGKTHEGIERLQSIQAAHPDAPGVHQGLAWAYLSTGEFTRGWSEYLHRPVRDRFAAKQQDLALTTSLPADLTGRRVCLLREQGLGDELFFARFAPALLARGASVSYRADARLVPMLSRTGLFTEVVAGDAPPPAADYYVLLGDLPLALMSAEPAASRSLTPRPLPLAATAEALDRIAATLAQCGPPPYIGLTWRGGIAPEQNRGENWAFFKQVPLAAFAAACRETPATLLILQRNPTAEEVRAINEHLGGRPTHDLSALNADLEAMLALMSATDDYIGVSNTNMHLRAGAGKAARVLVPVPPEWRWMASGAVSPWFPGFSVYRQNSNGEWRDALAALRADLAAQSR